MGTHFPSKQNQTLQASPEDCFLFRKMGSPSVSSLWPWPDPELVQKSRSIEHFALQASEQPLCPWATRCYCRISGHSHACLGNNAGNPQGTLLSLIRTPHLIFLGTSVSVPASPTWKRIPNSRHLICHVSPVVSTFCWLFIRNAQGREPFEDGANYPSVEFGFKLQVPLAVSKL